MQLPAEFTNRMKEMLGEEYPAFLASYEEERLRGLRVNTMKLTPEEFEQKAPFPIRRIPWVKNGFFYSNDIFPARHPFYQAGVYYLQEPSAMTPASRLPVNPGDRVLDLCAAPGGKATELAARLAGSGFLVANDISNSRARALLRNLELFGASNILVTNETPEKLNRAFASWFDKILVDAPCSGEGMFRKAPEVADTWSPERVQYFAAQQRTILKHAYEMLKPGGWMMYSTCTFSADEDEGVIAWFLREHPDMQLQEMEPYEGFSEGRPEWADGNAELRKCVRIWPHKMPGEGHFLALLRKLPEQMPAEAAEQWDGDSVTAGNGVDLSADNGTDGFECSGSRDRNKKKKKKQSWDEVRKGKGGRRDRKEKGAGSKEMEEAALLNEVLPMESISLFEEVRKGTRSVDHRADKAYLTGSLPEGVRGLTFLRNGLFLGEWKTRRFEPAQPTAMALTKENYPITFSINADDLRCEAYLRGESIRLTEEEISACRDDAGGKEPKGWILVCVDRFPLGWGKYAAGLIKNKYPVSWRIGQH
ncbi:MAG: RsmB/NOP family class I SAM-dependent RNA methyltransferase [Eubacteriales bacterium]|nr:RsmB/NOP family class I SAM-dependent RNA methyltransferase [Eubacteriales bacterium]